MSHRTKGYVRGFDRVNLLGQGPFTTSANYSRKDGRIFGGLVKHVLGSIKKVEGILLHVFWL